jgi:hypothetical protein
MDTTIPAPTITEPLCEAFAAAADALSLRRANRIPEKAIDDFVALGWMRWHGGSLRITPLGQMALARIRTRLTQAAA